MRGRVLDESWCEWLRLNLNRKCPPEELLEILLKQGFAVESIQEHMGPLFPARWTPAHNASQAAVPDYAAISRVRLTRTAGGSKAMRVLTDRLQLYRLEAFLSADECDRLVCLSARHLRASTVTTGDRDPGYRTSNTSDLSLLNDPLVKEIDERIARTVGIRLPYSEGLQAQRYEVGQEFKRHTDYFQPGTEEYAHFAGARGQRTWTFMVYLDEGMKGGGTRFAPIDGVFIPVRGMALAWNNLCPDGTPNPHTAHSGLPVASGHKTIITKWFREHGTGPMFYED